MGAAKMRRSVTTCTAILAAALCLFQGFGGEGVARVVPPVAVTLAAVGPIAVGREVTVVVVLQAGELADVGFNLSIPYGWTLVSGDTKWFGSLRAGEPVRFEVRVVMDVAEPQPIQGTLRVPGWEDTEWLLQTRGGVR